MELEMTVMTPDPGLLQAMHIYFQGEKTEALIFILPVGLLSLVFSAWLLTDNSTSFMRGVAIPLLLMGLLMTTVGAVVGYRTPGQVAALEQSLQVDQQAALQMEIDRMTKVNKAWPVYLAIWGFCGVLGLVLRFATSADLLQGMGIALIFVCGVGLLVDGFAERRTQPYVTALRAQA
jgi:hypothetical protein